MLGVSSCSWKEPSLRGRHVVTYYGTRGDDRDWKSNSILAPIVFVAIKLVKVLHSFIAVARPQCSMALQQRRRRRSWIPPARGIGVLVVLTTVWLTTIEVVTVSATTEEKKNTRPKSMMAMPTGGQEGSPGAVPQGLGSQRQFPSPDPDSNSRNGDNSKGMARGAEASTTSKRRLSPALHRQLNATIEDRDFMNWCKNVLGISTLLEIQTFEYLDHMGVIPRAADNDEIETPSRVAETLQRIQVRGLAATRDITAGETVISIPVQALLSVATTIDHDPVLSRVMGPQVRQELLLTTENNDEASYTIEMPLLAIALLHHRRLGQESPLFYYIRTLQSTPIDTMPFLWHNEKLLRLNTGTRKAAKSVRQEMLHMYREVVQKLIDTHPEILGPREGEEWMFSMEKFSWAFAMLNSRHWELPVDELDSHDSPHAKPPKSAPLQEGDQQGLPPANMPTEDFVHGSGDVSEQEAIHPTRHSFLAPVADLLNFGPPCTRGIHNKETHSFEIIATCNFRKGQEVTFWYSDECEDVMVSVYGFTHPMIPPCPSAEEYRRLFEDWKARATQLEVTLAETYDDLDHETRRRQKLEQILDNCDCCAGDDDSTGDGNLRVRHDNGRPEKDELARHGVRRPIRPGGGSRKSEF